MSVVIKSSKQNGVVFVSIRNQCVSDIDIFRKSKYHQSEIANSILS